MTYDLPLRLITIKVMHFPPSVLILHRAAASVSVEETWNETCLKSQLAHRRETAVRTEVEGNMLSLNSLQNVIYNPVTESSEVTSCLRQD